MFLLHRDLVRSCEKKEVSHVTVTLLFVKPFTPNISFFKFSLLSAIHLL